MQTIDNQRISYMSPPAFWIGFFLSNSLVIKTLHSTPPKQKVARGRKKAPQGGAAARARDSVGIRTLDPQIRNLLLYPAELRNRPYEIPGLAGIVEIVKVDKIGCAKLILYYGIPKLV